jgi:hypothetical protein
LNSITSETLTPLVSYVLGVDKAQIVNWKYEAVHGGTVEFWGGGLYRFHGRAKVQDLARQWILILKIIRADSEFYSDDPSTWNYWKREALAYESGLLDDLPGQLAAPLCFGVHNVAEDEIWIWLEAIPEETITEWPLNRYGVAARHLGQFNGAYLTDRSLPSQSWFSNGRIDEWLVEAEEVIPRLHEYLGHPLTQLWFPDDAADRTIHIWSLREELLEGISNLPRTLCHHDAFRRNLFAANDQDGHDKTYAIDWSMIGPGVIGEEIATTFTVTLQFLDCDASFSQQLDKCIFEGYLAGLRDAGWSGKSELARFGFTAVSVLFMGLGAVGSWLPWIIDENERADNEKVLGQPLEKVMSQWAKMQGYLFDLADEALALKEAMI